MITFLNGFFTCLIPPMGTYEHVMFSTIVNMPQIVIEFMIKACSKRLVEIYRLLDGEDDFASSQSWGGLYTQPVHARSLHFCMRHLQVELPCLQDWEDIHLVSAVSTCVHDYYNDLWIHRGEYPWTSPTHTFTWLLTSSKVAVAFPPCLTNFSIAW